MRRFLSGLMLLLAATSCADEAPLEPCTSDGVGGGFQPATGTLLLRIDDGGPVTLSRELNVFDDGDDFAIHGCDLARGDQFFMVVGWPAGGPSDFNFTELGGPLLRGRIYRCEGGETCLLMQPDWLFRREEIGVTRLEPDRVDGTIFLSERESGRARGFFTVHQFEHVTDVEFDLQWEVGHEM